jgi:hypothetical protein
MYLVPEGEENLLFMAVVTAIRQKVSDFERQPIIELIEIDFLRPILGTSVGQYRVIHCFENLRQWSDYSATSWRFRDKLRLSQHPSDLSGYFAALSTPIIEAALSTVRICRSLASCHLGFWQI